MYPMIYIGSIFKIPLFEKLQVLSSFSNIPFSLGENLMEQSAQRIFQIDPERRLEFEMLISDISACFIRLHYHEVDQQIEANMRRILEFLHLDRSTLWQLSEEDPDQFANSAFR